MLRFQDSILTGSARLQQPAPANQPYPGDVQLDQTATGSVARANVMNRDIPVPRPEESVGQGGVQVAAAQPFPARQPAYGTAGVAPVTSTPLAAPNVDATVTGGTGPAKAAPSQDFPAAPSVANTERKGGWGREGGSKLTVQPGETVYNLSRRFGIPVNAILAANGLGDASELQAGQEIVIPTYANGADVAVSAPDNNPKVANARSTTGFRNEGPAENEGGAGDRVAVLPQQPKLKEAEPGAQTAASNAETSGANVYTVVAGDTLSGISGKTGASIEALKQANGLGNGLIRIGQKLTIPGSSGAAVQVASSEPQTKVDAITTSGSQADQEQPGEQVAAYTPPTKPEKVIRQATAEAPDATGIGRMRWPVRGRVVDGFGAAGAQKNDGIDIAVPEGTPVKAAENGVVIYAGDGLKEFGNTVLVRHEDGLVTVYGHASELKVERGQKVRRGEEIALAGMSGSADRPKLHFEVRKDSAPVDPIGYLE